MEKNSELPIKGFIGVFAFLSNFHPCKIEFEGLVYPTAEHAYQASKAAFVSDREAIRFSRSAAVAKRYAKNMVHKRDYDRVKVMKKILTIKFSDPIMRDQLLATQDIELIEGNYWHDNFWGACVCDRCIKVKKHNVLGRLLVEVREEIRDGG